MATYTLNILKPSVNNLTARVFVRAAGLDFEEVDVWGQTMTPEFLAKDPAHLTPMLEAPDLPRGAVKVPALWGYGAKRYEGQFCDGFGNGLKPGWAVAVELVAGQTPDVVRKYTQKIEAAEIAFSKFLPPPYPFDIDTKRAAAGQKTFKETCSPCHGEYERDAHQHPIYLPPKFIPWKSSNVRTDRDRLDGNTPDFRKLVESNRLSELIEGRPDRGHGYFAPRLVGIWARYPYLHNGSVPSIAALLTPPDGRPTVFSLRDAGEKNRFDPETLGLTVAKPGSVEEADRMLRDFRHAVGLGDEIIVDEQLWPAAQVHRLGLSRSDHEK